MSNNIDQIIAFCEGSMSDTQREAFRESISSSEELCKDLITYIRTDQQMRAHTQVQEIINDPGLKDINKEVDEFTETRQDKAQESEQIKDFVKGTIDALYEGEPLHRGLSDIEIELRALGIVDILNTWVEKWSEKSTDHIIDSSSKAKGEKMVSPGSNRKVRRIAIISSAAVITLLVSLSIFLPRSPESLYQKYYKPLPEDIMTARDASGSIQDVLEQGVNYYISGQYSKSTEYFIKAIQSSPKDAVLKYYTGLSLVAEGDYKNAVEILSGLNGLQGDFQSEITWYLGLSYLALDDTRSAKPLLELLQDKQGFYQADARKILRRLK